MIRQLKEKINKADCDSGFHRYGTWRGMQISAKGKYPSMPLLDCVGCGSTFSARGMPLTYHPEGIDDYFEVHKAA